MKFKNIAKRFVFAMMGGAVLFAGLQTPTYAGDDPWAALLGTCEAPANLDDISFFNTDFVVSGNVNFRTSPSSDRRDNIIQLLDPGTVIELHRFTSSEHPDWSYVSVNGQMGYVSSQFVRAKWEFEEQQKVDAGTFVYPTAPSHIGTIELLPWSEVRRIWPVGTVAQVTDVRTGLVYNVRNMSNGNHADVETVTQADTNIMNRTYGGVWSWATRPIIVSVNGRHIAASINGMPHAGSTISGNGMNGHVCIHFQGSRTHNGNQRHTNDHQNSVQEAFRVFSNR